MNAHSTGKRSRSVISCVGRTNRPTQGSRALAGFTLVELLVVIGIIVILMGILVPTVSGIRKAGMRTKSASIVSNLASAVQRYQQEFGAFPGPKQNREIKPLNEEPPVDWLFADGNITMSENLLLALSGGLYVDNSDANQSNWRVRYNADLIGSGPRNLNFAAGKINRQYPPYIEGVPMSQPGARFKDDAGQADDTIVPEYLDGYGDPLPILYLRANLGMRSTIAINAQRSFNNDVCTDYDINLPGSVLGQYDLSQLRPYTNTTIGVGKDSSKEAKYKNSQAFPAHGLRSVETNLQYTLDQTSTNYAYPYDAYALLGSPQYRLNPTSSRFTEPRQRDGFILIAAGPDRIYGTEDDVYSFGSLD